MKRCRLSLACCLLLSVSQANQSRQNAAILTKNALCLLKLCFCSCSSSITIGGYSSITIGYYCQGLQSRIYDHLHTFFYLVMTSLGTVFFAIFTGVQNVTPLFKTLLKGLTILQPLLNMLGIPLNGSGCTPFNKICPHVYTYIFIELVGWIEWSRWIEISIGVMGSV